MNTAGHVVLASLILLALGVEDKWIYLVAGLASALPDVPFLIGLALLHMKVITIEGLKSFAAVKYFFHSVLGLLVLSALIPLPFSEWASTGHAYLHLVLVALAFLALHIVLDIFINTPLEGGKGGPTPLYPFRMTTVSLRVMKTLSTEELILTLIMSLVMAILVIS